MLKRLAKHVRELEEGHLVIDKTFSDGLHGNRRVRRKKAWIIANQFVHFVLVPYAHEVVSGNHEEGSKQEEAEASEDVSGNPG